MGIASQVFEGISTNIPGVYTKQKFPASLGAIGADSNIVAILGSTKGGIPYNASGLDDEEKVNIISSVSQAQDVLIGGDGFYMTEFFLTPSNDPNINPPSKCIFVRVDPAVQGDSVIKDGSSNDIIDLKSTLYGTYANQISRKIEAGTISGHKVTVKFLGEIIGEKDDIDYDYMTIQYTGAGTAATMTINATTLSTSVTGASSDDLSLTLSQFTNLDQLVNYINEQANYTCILTGRGDSSVLTFDAVTAQDIKTAEYTAKATVQALIDWFNNSSGGYLIASLHSGAVRTDVANDTNYIFMANGSNGTASSSDWSNALALLKKINVNHVLLATGDDSIHSMLKTHLIEMAKIEEKKNRSGGVGSSTANSTSVAARITEAKSLGSARMEYWATPFKRPDVLNGNQSTVFAPFFGAAIGAGIRFGNYITISATFKNANVLGVTEKLDTETQKKMIDAGCSLMNSGEEGVYIVHNVSTYQSANLILNLPSMLRTADFITLDSQKKLQARIARLDRAPNALVIADMVNYIVTNLLPGYVNQELLTDDLVTGRKAFSDVEFNMFGDRFEFKFTGVIPAPLHFVFQTQNFVVVGQRTIT